MLKPTQPLFRALRRLALTTKMVNGGFYKGNRTGSMGRHTKDGRYVIEWWKVRTYVAPANLTECTVTMPHNAISVCVRSSLVLQLTPFVKGRPTVGRGIYAGDPMGPSSGQRYLNRWKVENGQD